MSTKSNKILSAEEVTAETYQVPAGEEGRYHVKMEIPRFDPNSGKKLSKARIMKFGAKTFKNLSSQMKKQGYTMEILHDPFAETEKQKKTNKKQNKKAVETEAPEVE